LAREFKKSSWLSSWLRGSNGGLREIPRSKHNKHSIKVAYRLLGEMISPNINLMTMPTKEYGLWSSYTRHMYTVRCATPTTSSLYHTIALRGLFSPVSTESSQPQHSPSLHRRSILLRIQMPDPILVLGTCRDLSGPSSGNLEPSARKASAEVADQLVVVRTLVRR
jgi:hypothetical protein